MNKPIPHKIGDGLLISDKTFNSFSFDALIKNLYIVKYCEMSLVIDEYLDCYEDGHTAESA